jgi:hypothetical protein
MVLEGNSESAHGEWLSERVEVDRGVHVWAALAVAVIAFTGFARSFYLGPVFSASALPTIVKVTRGL